MVVVIDRWSLFGGVCWLRIDEIEEFVVVDTFKLHMWQQGWIPLILINVSLSV
jgi:hypothetical protein